MRRRELDLVRRDLVEAARRVRMPPDRREHLLVRLGKRDDPGVRRVVEPDAEDAPDARLAGGGDQLAGILLTQRQVSVAVDHRN